MLSTETSRVTILSGLGDGTFEGTFSSSQAYVAGDGPVAFVTADLDGDGFDDLLPPIHNPPV